MSHYRHLSMWERESLQEYRREGKSIREIGRLMRRSASTISREIRRNGFQRLGGDRDIVPTWHTIGICSGE
ncbi:MAG: helix-turn-helix domain-containing protein [Lentisphaerae bacterium]|nr:helix-turn-helix domain-containing protein [Lentisphaerota bacterium]